jgi:hypothetical protein
LRNSGSGIDWRCIFRGIEGSLFGIAVSVVDGFGWWRVKPLGDRSGKSGWAEGATAIERAEVEADLDRSILDANGFPGFWGYLQGKSQEGILIVGKKQSNSKPLLIKGSVVWINWAIELLTICGITTLMSRWRVLTPFSEASNCWFDRVMGGWEVHFKRCGEDFGEVALTLGKAIVIRRQLKLRQQQAWILDRSDLDEIAAAMRKHHGADS